MEKASKIYVAGHRGLVGSAITRVLEKKGYTNLVFRTRAELDLMDPAAVRKFFETEKPEYVFGAAAKVGGVVANNTYPAEFIYENLTIQNNIIHNCYTSGVKKLVFLGSSCIYPRECPQPMKEEYLLTGLLEPTNEAYAVAKIAGIIMCRSYNKQYGTDFVTVMPCNTYGPNDHYDLKTSHVLPALIRKFYEAKTEGKPQVELWGTGTPLRECIHVNDVADACVFVMENHIAHDLLNVGSAKEYSIKDLAELVKRVSGYEGEIVWDATKPDGIPRKLMDMSRLHSLGWHHKIELEEGMKEAYQWYAENHDKISNA